MQLKRINYTSAIYFGAVALIMYLISGILQLIVVSKLPELQANFGAVTPLQSLVIVPIIGGVVAYLFVLVSIFIYNSVAQKFPISWTVSK